MSDQAELMDFESLFLHRNEACYNLHDISEEFSALQKSLKLTCDEKAPSLQRLISQECAEIQRDELLALKCIFSDELALVDEESKVFKVCLTDPHALPSDDAVVNLWFCIPIAYPNVVPIFEIEGSGALSKTSADKLYDILLTTAMSKLHETMIYDLIMIGRDYVCSHVAPVTKRMILERERLEKDSLIESQQADLADKDEENVCVNSDGSFTFSYSPRWHGLNPSTYTGPIYKILNCVPPHLQVYSIENIVRSDLAERFERKAAQLATEYSGKERKFPNQYSTSITLGFHGTSKENLPLIVKTGLKVPGEESGVKVVHGSYYGVGIYLSPSPEYSLGYSEEGSLLVCAVVLGHCLRLSGSSFPCQPRLTERTKPMGRVDSVFSPCGNEMVIFNAAQVLPCLVIKLGQKCKKGAPVMVDSSYAASIAKHERANETATERQERLKKRAAKYLPYGYGPASTRGRAMIVEDVADSDDDEEQYGEFQEIRYEQ